jgi:hypothetical protein
MKSVIFFLIVCSYLPAMEDQSKKTLRRTSSYSLIRDKFLKSLDLTSIRDSFTTKPKSESATNSPTRDRPFLLQELIMYDIRKKSSKDSKEREESTERMNQISLKSKKDAEIILDTIRSLDAHKDIQEINRHYTLYYEAYYCARNSLLEKLYLSTEDSSASLEKLVDIELKPLRKNLRYTQFKVIESLTSHLNL